MKIETCPKAIDKPGSTLKRKFAPPLKESAAPACLLDSTLPLYLTRHPCGVVPQPPPLVLHKNLSPWCEYHSISLRSCRLVLTPTFFLRMTVTSPSVCTQNVIATYGRYGVDDIRRSDQIRALMDRPTNIRNMSVIAHGMFLFGSVRGLASAHHPLLPLSSRPRQIHPHRLSRLKGRYHR